MMIQAQVLPAHPNNVGQSIVYGGYEEGTSHQISAAAASLISFTNVEVRTALIYK